MVLNAPTPTPAQRAAARSFLASLLPHPTAVENVERIAALIAERDSARKDVVKLRCELGSWFPIIAAVASAADEPNGILIKPDLCKHAEALLREMGR